jgi:carbon storage regulator
MVPTRDGAGVGAARPACARSDIMLVLARRIGEEIVINGNIRLTVLAVKGDHVRLGITAPPSVAVDRKEVRDRRVEQAAVTRTTIDEAD